MNTHPNSVSNIAGQVAKAQRVTSEIPQFPIELVPTLQALGPSVAEWLRSLAHRKYSVRTLRLYTSALRDLLAYMKEREVVRVQDLDLACLEGWRAALVGRGFVPNSVTTYLGIARNWCRWLSTSGRSFVNPAGRLTIPAATSPMGAVLSADDMRRFVESIDGTDLLSRRDRAVVELAYASGARLEEIARLNVESLDLDRGLVRLMGKGKTERIVPLTRCAVAALRSYTKHVRPFILGNHPAENALFVGCRRTGRLCTVSLSRLIRNRGVAVNLDVLPHTIRRSFATHLVQGGAPIAHVKALLGHASYRHMGRYVLLRGAMDIDALREGRSRR